jgi:hypothetical protein
VFVFRLVDGRTVEAESVLVHGEQVDFGDVVSVSVPQQENPQKPVEAGAPIVEPESPGPGSQ